MITQSFVLLALIVMFLLQTRSALDFQRIVKLQGQRIALLEQRPCEGETSTPMHQPGMLRNATALTILGDSQYQDYGNFIVNGFGVQIPILNDDWGCGNYDPNPLAGPLNVPDDWGTSDDFLYLPPVPPPMYPPPPRVVPEPATLGLVMAGVLGVITWRRSRP